jgi:hypothetical protein
MEPLKLEQSDATKPRMRPLILEQSDTTKQNETTKPRTIRYNEQTKLTMKPLNLEQSDATKQKMRPLKLEQSDTLNSNKTENEIIKTRTIRYNEQQENRE